MHEPWFKLRVPNLKDPHKLFSTVDRPPSRGASPRIRATGIQAAKTARTAFSLGADALACFSGGTT
jgi:hypothetical protein